MLVLRNNGVNTLATRPQSPIDYFLDEIFSDLDLFAAPRSRSFVPATPGTNVYEDGDNLIYELELAGVKREDVKVKLEQNVLQIQAEIQQDKDVDQDRYLNVGRRYGKFERRYRLPEGVLAEDAKKIRATLEDGLLKVSLPLKKSLKPQAIDIKVN